MKTTKPNCASAWLRQNLRELELATNWGAARARLQAIQHQARDDVAVIALWQLSDLYAHHERLTGLPENPLTFYQGVEGWQAAPWFRKDPQ